jgi:hypothetical protein
MPSHHPKAFTLTLSSDDIADNGLRMQRIGASDLALLARHHITDWRGQPFDPELLCRLGQWWVNDDHSVIFMGLGGGSFEVPEMHALVWRSAKVHIECGGGGQQATEMRLNAAGGLDVVVYVTHIAIPPELADDTDALVVQVAQAFAARHLPPGTPGTLTLTLNRRPS